MQDIRLYTRLPIPSYQHMYTQRRVWKILCRSSMLTSVYTLKHTFTSILILSLLRQSCNLVEARFEAMAEKNEASQKKQEEDVDSSLALLERLQQTQQTHTAPPQEKPHQT